eukprot:TRINITY_DN669_c4_g1_i1.p1 TRINITY_DN669_c4_g1~~TRINITY_DN669_c4_g1_i1.p1  ORF type:complete len:838 (+),score=240.31 TRINITY_DN669_c4_g1_i1:171-2684(+)
MDTVLDDPSVSSFFSSIRAFLSSLSFDDAADETSFPPTMRSEETSDVNRSRLGVTQEEFLSCRDTITKFISRPVGMRWMRSLPKVTCAYEEFEKKFAVFVADCIHPDNINTSKRICNLWEALRSVVRLLDLVLHPLMKPPYRKDQSPRLLYSMAHVFWNVIHANADSLLTTFFVDLEQYRLGDLVSFTRPRGIAEMFSMASSLLDNSFDGGFRTYERKNMFMEMLELPFLHRTHKFYEMYSFNLQERYSLREHIAIVWQLYTREKSVRDDVLSPATRPAASVIVSSDLVESSSEFVCKNIYPFFVEAEQHIRLGEKATDMFASSLRKLFKLALWSSESITDHKENEFVKTVMEDHVFPNVQSGINTSTTSGSSSPGSSSFLLSRLASSFGEYVRDRLLEVRGKRTTWNPEGVVGFVQDVFDLFLALKGIILSTFFRRAPNGGVIAHSDFISAISHHFGRVLMERLVDTVGHRMTVAEATVMWMDQRVFHSRVSVEKRAEIMQEIVHFLAFIVEKDILAEFYERSLMLRLLSPSASVAEEQRYLGELRGVLGVSFTSGVASIIRDIETSNSIASDFHEKYGDETKLLRVNIIQRSLWNRVVSGSKLTIPCSSISDGKSVCHACKLFAKYYNSRFTSRDVSWLHHLDRVEMTLNFRSKRKYILTMRAIDAIVIMHLMESQGECSLSRLSELTGLGITTLRESVGALSHALAKKTRSENGRLVLIDTDVKEGSSPLVRLNRSFESRLVRMHVPAPLDCSARREVEESICFSRIQKIQAFLMRIMKVRRILPYSILMAETLSQMGKQFEVTSKDVKSSIEVIMGKGYIARSDDMNDIVYQA